MDKRHLLLLGVLMAQSQHGYRINEFVETNLGRVSRMRRATAYALLERLETQGFVRMDTQVVGNHPPRKVYSITASGKEKFLELLQTLLVRIDDRSSSADIALMFLEHLPRERSVELLGERVRGLRSHMNRLQSTPKHATAPGVDYAIGRKVALVQAELSWLEQTIATLDNDARVEDEDNQMSRGEDR